MKKILLYPGAFNPPHLDHESLIEIALKRVDFDEVWIMPSGNRPDKEIATSYADRCILGQLFVDSVQSKVNVPVKLIATEIEESNTRSTPELVNEIKEMPNIVVTQLCGVDGLEFLARKYGRELDGDSFLVVERKGYQLEAEVNHVKVIFLEDEGLLGISSTQIREQVKNGNVKYKELVSKSIAEYIEQRQLYQ